MSAVLSRTARAVLLPLLLPLLVFTAAAWQVVAGGPLADADEDLARELRANAPPTVFAELLADLGNAVVALPVLAAALLYAGLRGRRWRAPLAAALAMAAVPAVVAPLKALTDRPGPLGGTGYFPSGHAATAAVAYGAAALLVLPHVPPRVRRALPAAAVLVCAAVGAGLVWRGYHWPLDVLAAWCLGVPLLAAVRAGEAGLPADAAGARASAAVTSPGSPPGRPARRWPRPARCRCGRSPRSRRSPGRRSRR
ncbi:MAG TPA: phosphatase PAP2 family protein [Streptomyces sp.]|uniref:phosphatase PAP2 family protein n=1 Tax=Streptomyces sp. TaxID=1931 RepID=UPI002D272E96|nr:phosphatase PAP2 family protein [Streptomyces sp.]HZG02257.1 phosphatase PAP2 family protein [Streptomyces sp.]